MADKKTDRKSGFGNGDKKGGRIDREGKAAAKEFDGGSKGKGGKGRKGGRGDNAFADYLRYHKVGFELEEMVNDILIDKPANPYEVLAKMLKEKSDTYDVVAPPPTRGSKSSGSKKQAASHKLESTDDFPTLGA